MITFTYGGGEKMSGFYRCTYFVDQQITFKQTEQ